MSRPRQFTLLGTFLLIAVAAGVFVYQHKVPPKTVLLLPESDAVFYANLAPAPFVNLAQKFGLKELPPGLAPWQYPDFTERTGFRVDRDLDEIAISRPSQADRELATILRGRFDQERLERYFHELTFQSKSYSGKNIFLFTQAQQTSWVSVLDSRTIAVTETEPVMHTLIDNFREGPGGRPIQPLIRDYFGHVPFGSLAWAIGRFGQEPVQNQPGRDTPIDFLANTTFVLSCRYVGSIWLKAEFNSASEADAARVQQNVNDLLAQTQKGLPTSADDQIGVVLKNTHLKRNGKQTVVDVTVPAAVVRRLSQRDQ